MCVMQVPPKYEDGEDDLPWDNENQDDDPPPYHNPSETTSCTIAQCIMVALISGGVFGVMIWSLLTHGWA